MAKRTRRNQPSKKVKTPKTRAVKITNPVEQIVEHEIATVEPIVEYVPKPDNFAKIINVLGDMIDRVVYLFTKVVA
jgi:hypothetical protein